MSGDEQKLLETTGDVCHVVRDGEPVAQPAWSSCRLLLTDRRLVVAQNGSKRTIPHGKVTIPRDDSAVPDDVDTTGAVTLRVGSSVFAVTATDRDDFVETYCRANLGGAVILAKHPAVVGGVVRDEATWSKAKFALEEDVFRLRFPDGDQLTARIDDVGTVEERTGTVMGSQRDIVAVEHTDDQDRSVETHISGTPRHASVAATLFEHVVERREDDHELSETESQVLMALYSGVSPFEMADFVGISVDEVEAIYQHLLEIGAVDEVRTRTEVTLNAQGRNMASEAMSEQ
ncbi:Component of chemotaxis system associated with archaellum, contains CheF-like and HTH domain [Halapricum desulfuricans]|uniref:Taxis protein CheF n=1 Tax=Halapricum desulfuricans TaxID=2841257 RepID=A0A897NJZ0_9EURY|nr:CheF family chemotaxis protein [Halapricum desulfuricans]QSG12754.1 Component of chemotaxis system associated with archaellum, contains CheF-like and HTH domain [Halapricum desulfuricans]